MLVTITQAQGLNLHLPRNTSDGLVTSRELLTLPLRGIFSFFSDEVYYLRLAVLDYGSE